MTAALIIVRSVYSLPARFFLFPDLPIIHVPSPGKGDTEQKQQTYKGIFILLQRPLLNTLKP